MGIPKKYARLFEKAKSIRLDIGAGINKQKGCLGMDIVAHPGIDIIHDIQRFPWPVPDDICSFLLMSHVWEHVEPKYRFPLMDECWRICRHDGELWISCPYAGSYLEAAHPAHYMCPNEATFQFFDPDYQLWHLCSYQKPKPWKILKCLCNVGGCIELVLQPRKDKKGKALPLEPDQPKIYAAVQLIEKPQEEEVKWPQRKDKHGVHRKGQSDRRSASRHRR